jgi:hypothetical protein
MKTALLLALAAASVCACKERSVTVPCETSAVAPGSPASSAAPALWEPIDRSFKGCEGG